MQPLSTSPWIFLSIRAGAASFAPPHHLRISSLLALDVELDLWSSRDYFGVARSLFQICPSGWPSLPCLNIIYERATVFEQV
jgi:hypothetical protein